MITPENKKMLQNEKMHEKDFHHQDIKWTNDLINTYGVLVLKSSFIINAGACSLWLAFTGVITGSGFLFSFQILLKPIFYFSIGLVSVAISHCIIYISQSFYMEGKKVLSVITSITDLDMQTEDKKAHESEMDYWWKRLERHDLFGKYFKLGAGCLIIFSYIMFIVGSCVATSTIPI